VEALRQIPVEAGEVKRGNWFERVPVRGIGGGTPGLWERAHGPSL